MKHSYITKYSVWIFIVWVVLKAHTSRCCLQQEKEGLLQLKAYFMSASPSENREYLSGELRSWDSNINREGDCCMWNRVTCNVQMQRVTELALGELIRVPNYDSPQALNITLFQPFTQLISLDLSSNYIQGLVGDEGNKSSNLRNIEILNLGHNLLLLQQLTSFVGSLITLKKLFLNDNLSSDFIMEELAPLKRLQVLNLNGIGLFVPLQGQVLSNMTELRVLNLSNNAFYDLIDPEGLCRLRKLQLLTLDGSHVSVTIPQCLWTLTSLQVVDLSGNRCTGNLPQYINLPSLKSLNISDNSFRGRLSLSYLMNHSSLQVVSLSNNALQVEIEDPLLPSNIKLLSLGLGHCNLIVQANTFPEFLFYQSNLKYIDLSSNGLIGSFPAWLLHNNSNLEYLNLRNNSLTGTLDQFPEDRTLPLVHFDISRNKFSGIIPQHIGMVLSSLQVFSMSANSFIGHIPSSVGNMTRLEALDLSDNKLYGKVPRQVFSECTLLRYIMLSNNYLQGEIIPSFMNLTSLELLYLDNNNFVGTIQESLKMSKSLKEIDISNNMEKGKLPSWIDSFYMLSSLSFRRNKFHGSIPSSLCNLGSLFSLDLSENMFDGKIPSCDNLLDLTFLHMHGNRLTGEIPMGLANCSSLRTLDLGNNQLSGGIPTWINELGFQLVILLLEGNQLDGELPIELCELEQVNIINLSNNSISGAIPSCFGNLSFGAVEVSGDGPNLTDPTTIWNSFVTDLSDVNLPLDRRPEEADFIVKSRYASYKGSILSIMSALDLSCNKLSGDIPTELGQLGMIHGLNLSHNLLSGSIPRSFSKLKSIESLDLSSNNLSGKIPSQLVDLTFLEIFNVSYNNLSGQVPETAQFGGFGETNYRGNPFLCGSQLPRSCGIKQTMPTESTTSSTNEEKGGGGDDGFDTEVFLWSFGMSCITILVAFVVVLAINPYWRRAWFAFIDVKFLWWFHPWT